MIFVYNIISMITDINKYVEDFKGNVYKIINDHYLMLSPCNPNDKYVSELENDDFHIISYNNACMIINKQYNALPEKWNYEGKSYLANVLNIANRDEMDEHLFRIRLLPDHSIVVDDNGPSLLKLIRHKGKMYYIMLINEKLPRVKAYDLFGKFCQWVGIKYCKPVWCEDEEKFI